MSVKICGYCQKRVESGEARSLDFQLERRKILLWFCSDHCCFWGGAQHARTGSATTVTALRQRFGAGVEVVK